MSGPKAARVGRTWAGTRENGMSSSSSIEKREIALAIIREERKRLVQERLKQVAALAERAGVLNIDEAALTGLLIGLHQRVDQARNGDPEASRLLAGLCKAARSLPNPQSGAALARQCRRQARAATRLAGAKRRLRDVAAAADAGRKDALGNLVVRAEQHRLPHEDLDRLAGAIAQVLKKATDSQIETLAETGLQHRRKLLAIRYTPPRLAPQHLIALGAPLLKYGLDAWAPDAVLGGLILLAEMAPPK